MPAIAAPEPADADEDTLSGLEGVPVVDTMIVPPGTKAAADGDGPSAPSVADEPPKERFSVRAARLVVALAVVAALALLVYWLLGQSR
jgi:hypothetical protein